MSIASEYQNKLVTADRAAQLVESGNIVDYGFFNAKPVLCDQAIAARADELKNVQVWGGVTLPPVPEVATKPDTFEYHDLQYSKLTRLLTLENPTIRYVPVLYHLMPTLVRNGVGPERDIGYYRVCPMDEHGWFNLGPQNSETRAKMERNKKVVLEATPGMPCCPGGTDEAVHISEVDLIVEAPEDHGPYDAPNVEPKEADKAIARLLMEHITDGSVIQLGIGGLPNAVGKMIAESDLKNLGGHTEMFVDAYVDMIESGRMNGASKAFDRRRVAYTFAIGSKRMYDFLNHNPAAMSCPVTYTNDPRIISQHDNFISINNAIQVDLYTQVNAESNGYFQISGNGGMWDFVIGAQWSKGGKSFICLTSTYTGSDGQKRSRIVPTFEPGTITTIPRQMVDYIVTEYGVAHMPSLSTWQRAEAMINLAHPDFREDLIKAAEKQGLWRHQG